MTEASKVVWCLEGGGQELRAARAVVPGEGSGWGMAEDGLPSAPGGVQEPGVGKGSWMQGHTQRMALSRAGGEAGWGGAGRHKAPRDAAAPGAEQEQWVLL